MNRGEESLANFARRRLGAEVFTYGLEPFVAGIFAGDPEKLSVRHAMPRLQTMEDEHGSLAQGGHKQRSKRERKKRWWPTAIDFISGWHGRVAARVGREIGRAH